MAWSSLVRCLVALGVAGASFFVAPAALAQLQAKFKFDLPPQAMDDALRAVGRVANVNVLFEPEAVKGKTSLAINGQFTAVEAINEVLKDTGLEARTANGDTVVVKPRTEGKRAEDRATSLAGGAAAQQVAKVYITGSRLQGYEAEGTSPVLVIDREQIDRSGVATLGQLLARLPQASIVQDESASSTFLGGTTIRLRGLSAGTTLILLNGRRMVASGVQVSNNFFNLRNIPLSAIERVEVLTDTASAIYGADAIAGVVNIILKKGLSQASADFRYGAATQGGLDESQASFAGGLERDRFRATWVFDAYSATSLQRFERERSANMDYRRFGGIDSRSTFTNPGTIYALPGSGNLPGLGSTFAGVPAGSTGVGLTPASFTGTAGTANLGSTSAYFSAVPASRTTAGFGSAEYNLTSAVTLGAELLVTKSHLETNSTPVALSGGATGLFQVPATNPFNPFGRTVGVDYLMTGVGARVQEADSNFGRALGTIRVQLTPGWDWESAAWSTRDKTFSQITNVADAARIRAALAQTDPTRTLNVFQDGPGASDEVLRALVGPPTNVVHMKSGGDQIETQFKGTVWALPSGNVDLVVGAERRKETLKSDNTFVLVDRDRTVTAEFGEVNIPLLGPSASIPFVDRLSLGAAVRRDQYSDFGSDTNPQFGIKWTVLPQLMARASSGSGFKAPSLAQLFLSRNVITSPVVDPARNNQSTTVPITQGGNLDLEPETAKSRNVGLVFTPTGRITASVDWWNVKQKQRIQANPSTTLIMANEALFSDRIQRAARTPQDVAAGLPGRLTAVDASALNLGSLDVSGVDMRFVGSIDAAGGVLTLTADGSYTLHYWANLRPDAPLEDRRRIASSDAYSPGFKGTLGLSWQGAKLGVSGAVRYTSSYRDYPGLPSPRTVASETLVDVQGTYAFGRFSRWLNDVKLTIGINNLFDKDPPFANTTLGFDNLQSSIVGRFAYASLHLGF